VWVIGKGDSCDPFTKNDAGGLQRRNHSAITTRNYLRVVSEFAKYFGKSPDKLGPNELRTYQAYLLTECKLTPGTVVNRVAALRFFFVKTLKRHQFRDFLPYPQDRRRLPTVLSREEVARLINAAGTLFRRALLMTLYANTLNGHHAIIPVRQCSSSCRFGDRLPFKSHSAPRPPQTPAASS